MKKKRRYKSLNASGAASLLDFLSEAGLLKRVRRSGWWVLGIRDPESVAEHSFRCAVVGYLLAKAEGVDPYPVVLMCLFGDIQEARINDLHKLGQRYINFRKAEEAAFAEQVAGLPLFIRNELSYIRKEYVGQKTREGIIARDADILECLLQAKEYAELGFKVARRFLKQAPSHLKTVSARSLWRALRGHASQRWWERLSKFER